MGRQTQLHLLPEDAHLFLDFAQQHDPVVVMLRDCDSPKIQALGDPSLETTTLTLWNKNLLSSLERKHIVFPGREYYGVDGSLPTLEFSPSRPCQWNGKPAILQGRIYGSFETPVPGYDEWYNSLARWIRANFIKSPLRLGGYVGPSALKWFEAGGILLPTFLPPKNPEWRKFVEDQHAVGTAR
jgi:hypothetical protein